MNFKQALALLLIILVWAVRNRHECVTPDCTGLCFTPGSLCLDCDTPLRLKPSGFCHSYVVAYRRPRAQFLAWVSRPCGGSLTPGLWKQP